MRLGRCFNVLFCLLVAEPSAARADQATPPAGEVLSLDQAIVLALQGNPLLKNASIDVFRADEQLAALRTKRLPSFNLYVLGSQQLEHIDFTFERGVFGSFPGIGPIPSGPTHIGTPLKPTAFIIGQVDQPLSQLYRINLNIGQLQLSRDLARESLRQKQHEIVQNVRQAYFAILQTQSGLQSAEETIRLYREIDRVTGEYLTQKVALRSDSLEVKMRLAKAEYDALTVGDQLAVLKQQLNRLLGRDVLTEFSVSQAYEPAKLEMELPAARARALGQRPELREARIRISQAEVDRRAKKAEYIPDLSLSFLYFSPRNFSSFIPRNFATLGLTLKWEVFDWGRKKHELAEKDFVVEQSRNGLSDAETSVLIDVDDKYRKLQQARQLLRIAELARESSVESVRVLTNRYQVQASLMKDVLQAQTGLEQANYQYQQALLSFWTARTDFSKAIGEDK